MGDGDGCDSEDAEIIGELVTNELSSNADGILNIPGSYNDEDDVWEWRNYCDENNLKIIAIYHSHTHSQAFPSTTDINNAIQSMWTDPFYILISLIEKTRPIIRGYKIGSDDVEEIIVEHDGPSYISPT